MAKDYAKQEFGFDKAEVGTIQPVDGYYAVWVWEDKRKPGGFVIVHVSKDNQVIGWEPGR